MAEYDDNVIKRIFIDEDVISALSYITGKYKLLRNDVINMIISDWVEYIDNFRGHSGQGEYYNIKSPYESYYIEITIQEGLWKLFKKCCFVKNLNTENGFRYAISEFLNYIDPSYSIKKDKGCGIKSIVRFNMNEFAKIYGISDYGHGSYKVSCNDRGYYVYIIYNNIMKICYIGRTYRLRQRIMYHISSNTLGYPITDIYVYIVDRFIDSCILEKYFIGKIDEHKYRNMHY